MQTPPLSPAQVFPTASPLSAANPSDSNTHSPAQDPAPSRAPRSITPPEWGSNKPRGIPFYIGGPSGHLPSEDLKPGNYKGVIYGWSETPPEANASLQDRKQRAVEYAYRVKWKINAVEHGSEGERNVKYQDARQFMDPAGYFSAGLLAAGYDAHKKITVTFNTYVGKGTPENLTSSEKRTYFAWEIAAGALEHDKVGRGGPINFSFMHIESKDKTAVSDLESIGKILQDKWERTVAAPMRDPSGKLAKRSGKTDAYILQGTLSSLRSDKKAFNNLSPEGQEAAKRTLDKNGQVIIPNLYGYPLAGYAFIPYTPYDGNAKNRPNQGLMVDLKNGTVREIHGDKDFAAWAKHNRDNLVQGFSAGDRQGGKDAHWPSAVSVLDNLIEGTHAHYPGRQNLVKDKSVPVSELFNYTQSRGSDYYLKFGNLNDGIASKFQHVNAKNAVWSDQTEVFGSSQQSWKAAKELWGNTFGYVPLLGDAGNIVFGVHDSVYGMTAQDRVGGASAAVLAGLQLVHDIATAGIGDGLDESSILPPARQNYGWKYNPQTADFELVRTSKVSPEAGEVQTPTEGGGPHQSETPIVKPEDARAPSKSKYTIALKHEIGPDGKTVLVPEGLSSENVRVLKREKHTDVIVEDKVYRYDSENPDVLTEVGTQADSKPLSGFVPKCGASGARLRRDLNGLCYTKWIEPDGTPIFQDAQAIEHRRLVPSPEQNGQPRTLIHEHRLYRVSPNGEQLIPQPTRSPVTYRSEVKGSLVDEPDFGFDIPGQPRSINNDTVVVNLGQISDLSNDQRTLRGLKINHAGKDYVVVEADTGIFYWADLNTTNGSLEFHRITANNNPLSSWLIEQHDIYKDIHGWAANGAPNNDIVVLPGMDKLEKKIIIDNKLTASEAEQLRQVLNGLSDEKKREILLNIAAWGKKVNVPTALKSIKLEPLNTPTNLKTRSIAEQNQFYAEQSREAIDKQFDATGIKASNQRIPFDLADDARNHNANEIVTWLYTRTSAPNYSEVIIKTGAGNCDQMAHVAVDTINISGGDAQIAQVKGHTFAVVGGPKGNVRTAGFSDPRWKDAWIVDPWAGITCRASDYPKRFEQRMQEWSASGKQILMSDGGTPSQWVWKDPMDPAWINAIHGDVNVFANK